MKHPLKKLSLLALLASLSVATPALAGKNPITDFRRTMFMSFGQHMLVFEAPVGMCFLDQSDYLEGSLMKQVEATSDGTGHGEGKIIAVFGDCLEIGKIRGEFQDQMKDNPENTGSSTTPLLKYGDIRWLNPDNLNMDDQISVPRSDYLDMREKTFRSELMKGVARGYSADTATTSAKIADNMTISTFMSSPDKYKFDDKTRRTSDGISLGYTIDDEIEYQKIHTVGIVSTTLVRQMPLEFEFSFSNKQDQPARDMKTAYSMMDTFLAQQVVLNSQAD